MKIATTLTLIITGMLGLNTVGASAAELNQRKEVKSFIADMSQRHGFELAQLDKLFAQTKTQESIIKAITRPAERKDWHQYRPIFLGQSRIDGGVKFWQQHAATLQRAAEKFGVDPSIIVGIIGVETRYGRHAGNYKVMDALSTLAFDYPPRSQFFRKELEHYLLMTREEKVDPLALRGSYAGAMGQPQFISSSYRSYAIDFNNDGKRDIWGSTEDAIGSVANYLARHGWQRNRPITQKLNTSDVTQPTLLKEKALKPSHTIASLKQSGFGGFQQNLLDTETAAVINLKNKNSTESWLGLNNFYVITRYNHSALYAMAVFQLGEEIKAARQLSLKESNAG